MTAYDAQHAHSYKIQNEELRAVSNMYGGYTLGWGTLALINAGLAQTKHRSGLNCFLISLLIGPLATFFIVISDKKSS